MGTNVFISFASKDRAVAMSICEALEHRGIGCWISSRNIRPGENFQTAIVRAIRSAKVMVLVFSTNSNNSEEIKKEIVLAGQSRLVVIPVRVEDVTPEEAFAYEFATRQWIDLFADWEQELHNLLRQIETVIGQTPRPDAAPIDERAFATPKPQPNLLAMGGSGKRNWRLAAGITGAAVLIGIAGGAGFWVRDFAKQPSQAVDRIVPLPPSETVAGPVPNANQQSVTVAPNRAPQLPEKPAANNCGGNADEQLKKPVLDLYDAIRHMDIARYAAQWTNDSSYVRADTGRVRTYDEKLAERREAFKRWKSVFLNADEMNVIARSDLSGTIRVKYTMIIYRIDGSRTEDKPVAELYEVTCLPPRPDGRWLIKKNVDYVERFN